MIDISQYEAWFITGSQHLYGPETLEEVTVNSREIVGHLDGSAEIPVRVVFKQLLTDTVDKLGASARQELYESLAPQDSKDRMVVYLAGFVAATLIAIGFAVIALLAGEDDPGVATAAIAAAASVPSVILGGLMGALTGK